MQYPLQTTCKIYLDSESLKLSRIREEELIISADMLMCIIQDTIFFQNLAPFRSFVVRLS